MTTISGVVDNTGTIAIDASNDTLTIGNPGATLEGGGQVLLSDSANNQIVGTNDPTLTNVDNTISGAGNFSSVEGTGLSVVNEQDGVIDATYSDNALILGTARTAVNDGTMEATGGGVLELYGQTVQNSGGGVIEALGAGSRVDLFESTIEGGTLATTGGGVIDTLTGQSNDVLDGTSAQVDNTGSVVVNNGSALTIQGTIDNTGAISLAGGANSTILTIGGPGATLEGGGQVLLSDSANNQIVGTNDPTLTNVNNTISGAGNFSSVEGTGLSVVNEQDGVIDATYSDNALILETARTVVNDGILEANGGELLADDNVSGSGIAQIGGGGTADFVGSFNQNATFVGAGELEVRGGYSGMVSGMGSGDSIYLATVPLEPGDDTFNSLVYQENSAGTGGTLSIVDSFPTSTPPGYGLATIYTLNLTGAYTISDFSVSALGGGTVISAFAPASYSWKKAISGSWQTAADWTPTGPPASFANVQIGVAGKYTVTDSQSVTYVNSLGMAASGATLDIASGATFTIDNGTGGGVLAGLLEAAAGGALVVDGLVASAATGEVSAAGTGASVDLDAAYIDGGKVNVAHGATVEATSGAASTIADATITDKGVLEAVDGATLTLLDTVANAAGGLIEASDITAAQVGLEGVTVNGGTLTTQNAGVISTLAGATSTLNGTTISAGSTLSVADGSKLTLQGEILDRGTIALDAAGDSTTLLISGDVTLAGGGQLLLSATGQSQIVTTSAGTSLANSDAISGAGQIGYGDGNLTLTNMKIVDATGTNSLEIDTGAGVVNSGTLEATGSGGLVIRDTVVNTGTVAAAATGAIVDLDGGSIDGGKVNIVAGATLEAAGGSSDPSTLSGATVTDKGTLLAEDGTTLTLENSVVNASRGVIEASDPAILASTIVLDNATIDGGTLTTTSGGVIETTAGSTDTFYSLAISAGSTVTVADASTLALQGAILNSGTLVLGSTGDPTDLLAAAPGAVFKDLGETSGAGQIGNGDGNLTLDITGTVDAYQNIALVIDTGNTAYNTGSLEATGGGGLTIDDAVKNVHGALVANGGNLTAEGAVTSGTASIDGATLDFKAASSAATTFSGTAGTLQLDDAGAFTGTVAGLASTGGGNAIDLTGVSFAGLTSYSFKENKAGTEGTLTLTEGGTSTAITLLGQYAATFTENPTSGYTGFVLSDDGNSSHGTKVSYLLAAPPV